MWISNQFSYRWMPSIFTNRIPADFFISIRLPIMRSRLCFPINKIFGIFVSPFAKVFFALFYFVKQSSFAHCVFGWAMAFFYVVFVLSKWGGFCFSKHASAIKSISKEGSGGGGVEVVLVWKKKHKGMENEKIKRSMTCDKQQTENDSIFKQWQRRVKFQSKWTYRALESAQMLLFSI